MTTDRAKHKSSGDTSTLPGCALILFTWDYWTGYSTTMLGRSIAAVRMSLGRVNRYAFEAMTTSARATPRQATAPAGGFFFRIEPVKLSELVIITLED